ncbi:putative disease resistance RPP13-like protein 1 [Quercus robur]|uniref:putative disease resistance RPP13-like protein 1 n=1 Tax=Quercus robur TaxID=38942 RepID=UPI0021624DD5|nr:putative disease resistance RPP13-like protein 1 [Quercus robur]
MVGALVGAIVGSLLSVSLKAAYDKLTSPEVVNYFKRKNNDLLLTKLKMLLNSADAVLIDAEEKQITNSAVKKWLDDLRDAVYVADDLLDDIGTEALVAEFSDDNEWSLQSLHSLKEFIIAYPSKASLPPSLIRFSILTFQNLKLLDGKGLQHLTSLQELSIIWCKNIDKCCKLKPWCKNWSKIAHIEVDNKVIPRKP